MQRTDTEFKNYLLLLAGLVLSAILLLALTAIYIEPLDGELTRLGGYSERDFGANSLQKTIGKDVHLDDRYDKYYDVVVVGDSFSRSGLWQSFFRNETGLSITTLDLSTTSLDDFVTNSLFRRSPPRIMVVEIGERLLLRKFRPQHTSCSQTVPSTRINHEKLVFGRQHISFQDKVRRRTVKLEDINLKYALLFIQRSLVRYLLKNDFTEVKRYQLSRSDLFSNSKNDQILIFKEDLIKATWTTEEIRAAACGIKKLQDRVQENNKTLFVLMLLPDKSTAYADYIMDPQLHKFPRSHPLLAEQSVNLPRIDTLLESAIKAGEIDVYLPNDTHFGTRGYELVALSLVRFLQ